MGIKKRIDLILFEKGYTASRTESQFLIRSGNVYINDNLSDKPGQHYDIDKIKDIRIVEKKKYVSRGGYKLEKALYEFNIKVKNKICMDIGCSTGGFTDCLLKEGAKKVYGVDVGYGQFDYNLRIDKRVTLFERTNIRYFSNSLISEKIDVFVVDVSFISVLKFIDHIASLGKQSTSYIILIKPQFESKKEDVQKGVVRSENIHLKTIKTLLKKLTEIGFYIHDFNYSPLKGPKGNIEFLLYLKKTNKEYDMNNIKKIVDSAHEKVV